MTINIYINIGIFFLGGFAATSLLLFFLKNPQKFEYLISLFLRIFSYIPLLQKKLFVYSKIGTIIQAQVNMAGASINKQAPNVLPNAMKIEWTKTGLEAAAFLRDGEVIVKLSPDDDNDKNTVISTLMYLDKGLLPQSRHCLDTTLIQATEFTTAKEIFTISKRESAIAYLINNCLEPEIVKNPKLGEDCSDLDILNNEGLFTRVLLKQYEFLGKKMYASTPNPVIQKESREFFTYLLQIALRQDTGVIPTLDFKYPRIRVRILLVAKQETKQWGQKPYVNRIKEAQSIGMEYLYVLAWGKENVDFAKAIVKEQELAGRLSIVPNTLIEYIKTVEHERPLPAICITTALNVDSSSEKTQDSLVFLRNMLEEHVAELKEGKIELVSVSREPGLMSKIVVKPLIEDIDAVHCIIEKYLYGSLGLALGKETLHVCLWDDNPAQIIAEALLSAKYRNNIKNIGLNYQEKIATVVIEDEGTRNIAVGKHGINVKLSSDLTGWIINIRKN